MKNTKYLLDLPVVYSNKPGDVERVKKPVFSLGKLIIFVFKHDSRLAYEFLSLTNNETIL